MPGWQTIALIAGGAGLLIGIPVARRSHQISPILSGIGHVFNYLASVAMVAVPLAVITGLVIARFRSGVLVAVVALGAALLMVIVYAVPESVARRSHPKLTGNFFGLAWERWTVVAKPIGDFNAWLLMGLFYFTLMLPFGALTRLFSDRLRLKKASAGEELWLAREQQAELTLDDARRQF